MRNINAGVSTPLACSLSDKNVDTQYRVIDYFRNGRDTVECSWLDILEIWGTGFAPISEHTTVTFHTWGEWDLARTRKLIVNPA
ncbi:MAG: hypothetical protein F6K62_11230 [Sphaerospermopsis sp. SIO1G2]|nr:hypothetical protein [Sphaerospermopsis sp. SIO1G2]